MLQAYPPPPETTEQGTTVPVERSTMNNGVEALDLTKSDLPEAAAALESFQSQSLLQHTNLDSQMESSSHPATGTASGISAEVPICDAPSIQDHDIDPTLLAISIHESSQLSQLHSRQSMSTSSSATSPTPDLAFSPLASISSLADPPTPSRDDSLAEPGVYNGEQDPLTAATTLLQFAATSTPSSATPMPYCPVLSTYQPNHPQPLHSSFGRNSQAQVPLTQKRTSVGPGRAAPRNVGNKEDTIRRARERRRQLVAEVERAKVELWETSIEGGVLMQLAKDNI
ncbi:hypothetical protein SERLA73DRAFT_123054 [Serpula lacrymans var. lacrymans S7.3]|uniref:Uncharacterized protein n=1 Tax=Serpula lacrymans var. lacrymans (strain S7.3) TaxID=936435 RepID=F8PWS4_SERL3|nr:hypothetical protein SERLA73DRAFT_123054 [Serpula lacrymans var. lacrymans S7.3]